VAFEAGAGSAPERRLAAILVAMVLALATGRAVRAGSVTLEIGVDCAAEPIPSCFVAVTNRGPETALKVAVVLAVAGSEQRAEVAARLEPGRTVTEAFPLQLPAAPATHAVTVTVSYTDANGYPLSAVAAVVLPLAEREAPGLSAALPELELADHGLLELALRNTGERPLAVRVRWHLPRELAVPSAPREVRLAPGDERRERFRAVNQGALVGSAYTVYAVLEMDGPRGPVAVLVPGRVVVTARESRDLRVVLGAVLALLAAAWLGAQWRGRSQR
jgi:hypothetical protein